MAVKLKKKSESFSGKKVQVLFRITENEKEDLEILAEGCEGISNIQDLISLAVKDLIKSNSSLIEELKSTIKKDIDETKNDIESEDIEIKKLLEEESKIK